MIFNQSAICISFFFFVFSVYCYSYNLSLIHISYEDCSRLLASIEQAFCGCYDGAPVSLSHELAVLDACPPTHKEDAC